MMITLICATSQNGVIGRNNRLPWRLPADMRRFKALTMDHHVLMGRKTYESIGRPLKGRTNIVITRQPNFQPAGCLVAPSLESALALCQDEDEVFIMGGEAIYRQALPLADRIYLTMIYHDFDGDTYMFDIDRTKWQETAREDYEPDEKNPFQYSYITLERRIETNRK